MWTCTSVMIKPRFITILGTFPPGIIDSQAARFCLMRLSAKAIETHYDGRVDLFAVEIVLFLNSLFPLPKKAAARHAPNQMNESGDMIIVF